MKTQSSFVVATVAVLLSSCSAKIETNGGTPPAPVSKDPTHVNFAQCSNAKDELVIDYSTSDLENKILNEASVSVRDITVANSPYSSFSTDQPEVVIWGVTGDPALREFSLSTQAGVVVSLSTDDYVTGTATYIPAAKADPISLNCKLSVSRPAALPVPTSLE